MKSERRTEEGDLDNWRTLSRREILRAGDGRFLKVEYHSVELPDGRVIEEWPWLITPDYVNIVAQTSGGEFICFRQPKYAVGGTSLALPGGYIEPDEDPLAAAQRELLEETGYSAATWVFLGKYVVDGNRGAGNAYLYLARDAVWQQPIDADDLEAQEMLLLSHEELSSALVRGEFRVLSWATVVALALLELQGTDAA